MGNTHIWILLQQDWLREKERAGSGGKTERTEQEGVHLSRISDSTGRGAHGHVQSQWHLPGTSAGCWMLKMMGEREEGKVCWAESSSPCDRKGLGAVSTRAGAPQRQHGAAVGPVQQDAGRLWGHQPCRLVGPEPITGREQPWYLLSMMSPRPWA